LTSLHIVDFITQNW